MLHHRYTTMSRLRRVIYHHNVHRIHYSVITLAALLDDAAADRPIPTVDLSATTPAGLYSLNSIVTDEELVTIDAEVIFALPDDAARLEAMPFK
jgi:type IV secretory pathway protease TraF